MQANNKVRTATEAEKKRIHSGLLTNSFTVAEKIKEKLNEDMEDDLYINIIGKSI